MDSFFRLVKLEKSKCFWSSLPWGRIMDHNSSNIPVWELCRLIFSESLLSDSSSLSPAAVWKGRRSPPLLGHFSPTWMGAHWKSPQLEVEVQTDSFPCNNGSKYFPDMWIKVKMRGRRSEATPSSRLCLPSATNPVSTPSKWRLSAHHGLLPSSSWFFLTFHLHEWS